MFFGNKKCHSFGRHFLNKNRDIIDVRLLLQKYINSSDMTDYTETELQIMDMDSNDIIDIIDVRLLLQEYINN